MHFFLYSSHTKPLQQLEKQLYKAQTWTLHTTPPYHDLKQARRALMLYNISEKGEADEGEAVVGIHKLWNFS